MDRNTVIGILLIGAILIAYSIINKPNRERMQEAQRIRDSLEQVQPQQDTEPVAGPVQEEPTQADAPPQATQVGTPDQDQLAEQFGVFGDAASGEEQFLTIESDLLKIKLTNKGGRIYSVELKEYQTHDGQPVVLFDGDSTIFGLNFFALNRSINTNKLYFSPTPNTDHISVTNAPETVSMRLYAGEDQYIEYVYTVQPDDYMIDFDIRFNRMQDVIAENISYIDLNYDIYVPGHEQGRVNESNYTSIFFKHFEDEVDKFNMRSKKELLEENIPTRLKWIAFKQQFFSSVIIADVSFSNANLVSRKFEEDSNPYLNRFTAQIGIPYRGSADYEIPMSMYFGPNHYLTLKEYGMELESLVALGGLFSRVFNRYLIIPVFNWLNRFISNYGLIILILTIIIKVLLFPLTYRSYLSMAKMRVLKPEIDEINERIPKDKAMERQQATMALYKKAGVSPLGGCLPVVLQMPILIALFRFFPTSIELRQEKFLWATDLSTYDSILDLPFNIPMYGDHVSLFTLLMTASTILTMRISNQASASQAQMPGMKGMMYIMPVMFMFILNNFSAALTYYYFLANIITFGQNQIFKQFVDESALRKKIQAKKKAAPAKSKFQKRMEDMAKQRGYQQSKKKKK